MPPGEMRQFLLRLSARTMAVPFEEVQGRLSFPRAEGDEYYEDLGEARGSADERVVQRQAFAGLIWSKQFSYLDIPRWLKGDPAQPKPPAERLHGRDSD